jgi:hypothetical protein
MRDPRGHFFFRKLIELDDHDVVPSFRRDQLQRLLAIADIDDGPPAMHTGFAAPIRIRQKVSTVSLNRLERSYAN